MHTEIAEVMKLIAQDMKNKQQSAWVMLADLETDFD